MSESVNLGRIISKAADKLPDSASCILKSSHTEESQGTQPRQPGGGDSSTAHHRWKGRMLSSGATAPLEQRMGSAGQAQSTPGSLQPLQLQQSCFTIPQQWAETPIFPLESSPLPSWSHEHARQTHKDHGGARGTDWPSLLRGKGIEIFSS